jgi:hypothetical protein
MRKDSLTSSYIEEMLLRKVRSDKIKLPEKKDGFARAQTFPGK